MRIIKVVLLMVSRDYHRSAQPSIRTVSEAFTGVLVVLNIKNCLQKLAAGETTLMV